MAGALPRAGAAVVGAPRAGQLPLVPVVEAAGVRAVPVGRGDASRRQPRAPPPQGPAPRRPDRRGHDAGARGERGAGAVRCGAAPPPRADGAGLLRQYAEAFAKSRRPASLASLPPPQRPEAAAHHGVRGAPRRPGAARAVHDAHHAPRPRGPDPGRPRAGPLPAPRVDRGAGFSRPGRRMGGARASRPLPRHDRRPGHAAARPRGVARPRVVGAHARGARAHPLRPRGPQRLAGGGGRSPCGGPGHGAARPRPLPAGPRGVRGVSLSVLTAVLHGTDVVILAYFLVLNSFYALLLILSVPEIWEQSRLAEDEDFQRLMQSDALPPITILVPAYNESATIEASVTAILTLEYRNYEVVVVNDGSKDDTMEQLRHAFDLYEIPRVYPEIIPTQPLRALYRSRARSRLLVLDKENGGKADSLNAAINASRFPLVIA